LSDYRKEWSAVSIEVDNMGEAGFNGEHSIRQLWKSLSEAQEAASTRMKAPKRSLLLARHADQLAQLLGTLEL
jgi:hypothetical protein